MYYMYYAKTFSAIVLGTDHSAGQSVLPYSERDATKIATLIMSGRVGVAPSGASLLIGAKATQAGLDAALHRARGY